MAKNNTWPGWYRCCVTFYVGYGYSKNPACPKCEKQSTKATLADREVEEVAYQKTKAKKKKVGYDRRSLIPKVARLHKMDCPPERIAGLLKAPLLEVNKVLADFEGETSES